MLGAFAAADQSIDHLTGEVRKAYIAAFHQDAKVSISIVDRRPIYVLGACSKAGTFKFSPGMTVSHALALLGGSDDERRDVYLQSELVRQRERHATSVRRLEKALVRSVVLHAERDGETPRPTSALVSISGGEKATLLIQKELNVRKLIGDLKQSQTDAARSAIATAQREIADISAKVTILNEHIGVKKLRKEALSKLTDSRSANPFLSNQVTGEVLDVEERRQEVLLSQSQAQRKLDQAKADLSKLLTEQALELEKEIAVVEQEVTEEGSAVSSSDLFVQELRMQDAGANMASDAPRFEIVRQTLTGPQRLSADEMTELKAGDLVQVRSNRPQ
jgi:protein involved in polysaccharide export with SLBB domain